MQSLTHSQLIALVTNTPGTLLLGIESLTDARARKTDSYRVKQPDGTFKKVVNKNEFGAIFKRTRFVGLVGAVYERAVNTQLVQRELSPRFETEALPWGEWLVPHKLISHKGEVYLRCQSTPKQRDNAPARVLDYRDALGRILSREAVWPFLPAPTISRKQSVAGLTCQYGFLDDDVAQVHVRTFKLSSIRKVRYAGHTYRLVKEGERENRLPLGTMAA